MYQNPEPGALETRVVTFTAIHSGVDPRKVSPMMRLAQDLDIKGDDASEFFDAFGEEFRVNLDQLNMHWDQHFHPEAGMILSIAFIALGCVTLACSLLVLFGFGGWLWSHIYISSISPYQVYRTPTWVGSGIASLLCWIVVSHRNRSSIPITIADLIDAAGAGRWVKRYNGA
jgi:hypothetical protein